MPVNLQLTMGLREWVLLLALSMLWGGSFFFTEIALAELPPLTLVLGRVGFAALALLALAIVGGHGDSLRKAPWGALAVMGLLNNLLPFCLIVWGQTAVSGGLASILNATTPLFTILLAHWLTADERLGGNRVAGILCGVVGVAVMMGMGLLSGLGDSLWAQGAILAAACSYACAGIYGRRFSGLPPITAACGQVIASSLMLLPLALLIDRPWTLPMPSPTVWGAIIGLALLCTALAYTIYFRILAAAGATNLLLVTLLIPVSAIAMGALFLGEQLQTHQIVGALLIGLALLLIDGRVLRLLGGGLLRRRARIS